MLGGDFNSIPKNMGVLLRAEEIACLTINIYDAWDKFKETVEGMDLEDRQYG